MNLREFYVSHLVDCIAEFERSPYDPDFAPWSMRIGGYDLDIYKCRVGFEIEAEAFSRVTYIQITEPVHSAISKPEMERLKTLWQLDLSMGLPVVKNPTEAGYVLWRNDFEEYPNAA